MIRFNPAMAHLGRDALAVVATGIGYYLAAMASLTLTRGQDGIAMLWPASGILLAVLLIVSRQRAMWHIAAAAVGSLAANLETGNALTVAFGFTAANITESALAAWLMRRRIAYRISFTDPAGLIRFCNAAIIVTLLSATIALAAAPEPSVRLWFSWFSTDLLGILIVTPVVLIVGRSLYLNFARIRLAAAREGFAVFAIVTIVTALTFAQSSFPMLFLPMLAVLFAAFRLGPLGAAGGVLIVAAASTIATTKGVGPQTLMDTGPLVRSLFLQFYLLMLFAAALPVATLLAARQKLVDNLATKMRLLELAESAAQVGHWRLDVSSKSVTWSEEVFRIHGLVHRLPPQFETAIEAYHPDDRDRVSAHIEQAIAQGGGFEFTARIVRPGGEIRHIFSKGETDHSGKDGSPGLFGIIQDITTQVAHEASIQDARARAEAAAQEALMLAETDLLTGIANRRKITAVLDEAVRGSQESGRPVSIAIFDIDHFKRINDTFGHDAGDAVLKRIAADAAAEIRSGDTVGRFGGEEFVIVLPDATAQMATIVAERVRLAIEAGQGTPCVTISLGVAELAPGEPAEALLKRADQALYVAKSEGRNTMRLAA